MNLPFTQPCNATFKHEVLLKCFDALQAMGFTRYKKENVDWPLEKGFHAWVGLNVGLYDEYVEINPFVGIHVVPVMKLYTSLEGRKYNRGIATYAVYMGEIAPKAQAFEFTRTTNLEKEAGRLAQLYVDVGLPYARSISSYERLLPLLLERAPNLGGYPERAASCLYLMGRAQEAMEFVNDFHKKEPNYFDGFTTPFLKFVQDNKSQ